MQFYDGSGILNIIYKITPVALFWGGSNKKKMLSFLLFLASFPVNEKFNGVFKNLYKNGFIKVYASGSDYAWYSQKDLMTKPENAIDPESNEE